MVLVLRNIAFAVVSFVAMNLCYFGYSWLLLTVYNLFGSLLLLIVFGGIFFGITVGVAKLIGLLHYAISLISARDNIGRVGDFFMVWTVIIVILCAIGMGIQFWPQLVVQGGYGIFIAVLMTIQMIELSFIVGITTIEPF